MYVDSGAEICLAGAVEQSREFWLEARGDPALSQHWPSCTQGKEKEGLFLEGSLCCMLNNGFPLILTVH
ncbi:uncharacterized [Tachysurus ichikawai]